MSVGCPNTVESLIDSAAGEVCVRGGSECTSRCKEDRHASPRNCSTSALELRTKCRPNCFAVSELRKYIKRAAAVTPIMVEVFDPWVRSSMTGVVQRMDASERYWEISEKSN